MDKSRFRTVCIGVGAIALAAVVALLVSGGNEAPSSQRLDPKDQQFQERLQRYREEHPHAYEKLMRIKEHVRAEEDHESKARECHNLDPTPPGIVQSPEPVGNEYVMSPVNNGWGASTKRRRTEVSAGLDGKPPKHGEQTTGRLAIYRQEIVGGKSCERDDLNLVDVEGVGALRITEGPEGEDGPGSAQRNGLLRFVAADGSTGTLDLATDKATLDGP